MRKQFIEQLKNPGLWELRKHTIRHKPSGIEFWTSNGVWFLDTDPGMKAFSLLDKLICWPHVRALRRKLMRKWLMTQAGRLSSSD